MNRSGPGLQLDLDLLFGVQDWPLDSLGGLQLMCGSGIVSFTSAFPCSAWVKVDLESLHI